MYGKIKSLLTRFTFHRLDWLEFLALLLGLWFAIYPGPFYKILFCILLIIPVAGLILSGLHGRPSIASLLNITKGKNGENKYDVADFMDVAAWAILFRVFYNFEMENFYSLLFPAAVASVMLIILLFVAHKNIRQSKASKAWIYASVIFNLIVYSCGATYGLNCIFDKSETKTYDTAVLDKMMKKSRKGKRSYYLQVKPWGHDYDREYIKVSPDLYDQIKVGDSVDIDLHEGLLNIPWYFIDRKKEPKGFSNLDCYN